MTKGLIILGKQGSGKSVLATKIASEYDVYSVSIIDGRQLLLSKNKYFFISQFINEKTKCVIFDDLPFNTDFNFFISLFDKIPVYQINKKVFEIVFEKIILIACESISFQNLPIGASFNRRFEIQQL